MGIFSKLFKKEPKVELPDLSFLKVDMHNHILPQLDDGSKSFEESIEMVKFMLKMGYEKIIVTPHTMKGGYDNTSEGILARCQELNEVLAERGIDITLQASSEYYLDEYFLNGIQSKDLLTFSDNYVLFELSYMYPPSNLSEVIFELNSEGYKPILAHPERYPFYADKGLNKFDEIKNKGVYFQLNLFSLVGGYGRGAQEIAKKMIDAEMVDFVGSDIHNMTQFAYMEKALKEPYVEKLMNSEYLLNKQLF